ncbi:MAG: GNAT family N-acetyltransferase [Kofleriaceae bacterium]
MLRILDHADIPSAMALLAEVGLAGGAANFARYLSAQPDGIWGELDGDTLVGMASVLRYGAVGFVGCMAVSPAQQGRGIGRRVLEHAHHESRRAGITTFLLEATAHGAHLYERLGYVHDYASTLLARTQADTGDAVSIAHDRAAIFALDRETVGCDRSSILGPLIADARGATIHTRDGLAGFGLVLDGRLGPVIAREPAIGRALIDRLAPGCSYAAIPLVHAPVFEANGFTIAKPLSRMRLGPPVPIDLTRVFALASPGTG